MSPDQINQQHGKPVWTCFGCKAESGLHWWNGLSVAVCRDKPECGKAYGSFIADEAAKEQAYQEYVKENQWWPGDEA